MLRKKAGDISEIQEVDEVRKAEEVEEVIGSGVMRTRKTKRKPPNSRQRYKGLGEMESEELWGNNHGPGAPNSQKFQLKTRKTPTGFS